MSGRRMLGMETEYAVTVLGPGDCVLSRELYAQHLLREACETLPHLPGRGGDAFLQNGSRFYVDAGHHPELSGPECLNPWDVVRYAKAGDQIVDGLAQGVRRKDHRVQQILVFKNNVDYSGSRATWGSHESYLHRADVNVLHRRLIPHLVSRVIYTGAGGFNAFSSGIEFMVSPRAAHITAVVSPESTSARGIIHTRDESLCGPGYRRQHVICGESLRSDLASWLRCGVTAIVVAMIEAGVACGDDVAIEMPVEALRTFSRDASVRATVRTPQGAQITALEIQRRYLEHAIEHLDKPFMPGWAADVCRRWSAILTRLEAGPNAVAATLDWAIKLRLYQRRASLRGIDWNRLSAWTEVVEVLERAKQHGECPVERVTAAAEDLDAFLALRRELQEIDTRFGQIGSQSLFASLDESGVLDHRVDGVDAIAEAMAEPPSEGRAHLRGGVIRDARSGGRDLAAGWSFVIDPEAGLHMDLSDPFTEQAVWRHAPNMAAPGESAMWADLFRLRRRTADRARG